MTEDIEKLELARLIDRTQHLLYHMYMRRVMTRIDHQRFPTLTPPQAHMVMTVREYGEMTLKQLASILHVKAPSASAMVERLVESGVLTREENPTDRREVLVRLSAKNESDIQEVERLHLQFALELIDRMGIECARAWAEVCTHVNEALVQEREA